MQLLRRLSFTMLLMSMMTLVACGGGDLTGGETGDDGGETTPDSLIVTATKSDGVLSAANDITVYASVYEGELPVANKTVTFTLAVEGSATLDPIAGTATTDEFGVASITVKVTNIVGSVNVIASYDDASDNISFDSLGDGVGDGTAVEELTLTVTKSDGVLSAANKITVAADLTDGGQPVANKTVVFTIAVEGSAILDPVAGTATTDENGMASIDVLVTDVEGSVNVIATFEDVSENISFDSLGDGVPLVIGAPVADSITLTTNTNVLASSGADSVEITVKAKDENNNILEGVAVEFSADSGSLAFKDEDSATNITGADGTVSMLLSTDGEPNNRVITVTVNSGELSESVEVDVSGTSISLTGSSSLAINEENNFTVKVVDSDNKPITKAIVDITTEAAGTGIATIVTSNTVTTDSSGQADLTVTGTSGGENTITATAAGTSISQEITVQPDSFLFTNFTSTSDTVNPINTPVLPDVALTDSVAIELTWNRDGSPVADGTLVEFTTTRGTLTATSATTVGGKVSVSVSSVDAGKALVTFIGTDSGENIQLTNQLEFEFYATVADRIIAIPSKTSIAPNGESSILSVIVRDPSGNLVKNKTVDFSFSDTSGGTISPAFAVTDSNGSASTVYTSNSVSKVDGVQITATVRDTPAVNDSASLTVSKRSAFITIGLGNTIIQKTASGYTKEYLVTVTDLQGSPIEGLNLNVSSIPKDYHKGEWIVILVDGEFDSYAPLYSTTCFNEDGSNGGEVDSILDVLEDVNTDGSLTPGNTVANSGDLITDESGEAIIKLSYAENFGGWVDVEIKVSATVSGSENISQVVARLGVLADDVTKEDNPPATLIWPNGPFGSASDCTDPD